MITSSPWTDLQCDHPCCSTVTTVHGHVHADKLAAAAADVGWELTSHGGLIYAACPAHKGPVTP